MTTRSPSRDTYPHWIFDDTPIPDPFGHGERAVEFLRRLKHPKSTLPRKQFQLDLWQERIVRGIYGPRDGNGNRLVSTVVILVPRGNRKTSLSAALALLHTIGPERVAGGEVIFAASDRSQAGIAFKEARSIVQADPKHLVPVTKVYDAFNSAKKIAYVTIKHCSNGYVLSFEFTLAEIAGDQVLRHEARRDLRLSVEQMNDLLDQIISAASEVDQEAIAA